MVASDGPIAQLRVDDAVVFHVGHVPWQASGILVKLRAMNITVVDHKPIEDHGDHTSFAILLAAPQGNLSQSSPAAGQHGILLCGNWRSVLAPTIWERCFRKDAAQGGIKHRLKILAAGLCGREHSRGGAEPPAKVWAL